MGRWVHESWGSLFRRGQVTGEIRSDEGKCRLRPRLAALFIWTLADSGFAGQTALLRKSDCVFSCTCTIFRSSARSGSHSFRRQGNHWIPAPAEEGERTGAAGDRGEWAGQPERRSRRELRGNSAFRRRVSGGRWPGNGTESD